MTLRTNKKTCAFSKLERQYLFLNLLHRAGISIPLIFTEHYIKTFLKLWILAKASKESVKNILGKNFFFCACVAINDFPDFQKWVYWMYWISVSNFDYQYFSNQYWKEHELVITDKGKGSNFASLESTTKNARCVRIINLNIDYTFKLYFFI